MSDQDYDQFQDVVNSTFGLFENSGIKAHDSVKTAVRREGVVLEFVCQGCNRGKQIVLEWPEVISLKYGVDPAYAFRGRPNIVRTPMSLEPQVSEGAWMPSEREKCDHCQFHYGIRVFFDEPERWLQQARRLGYVTPEKENPISAYTSSLAAGAAGQRPMPGPPGGQMIRR